MLYTEPKDTNLSQMREINQLQKITIWAGRGYLINYLSNIYIYIYIKLTRKKSIIKYRWLIKKLKRFYHIANIDEDGVTLDFV